MSKITYRPRPGNPAETIWAGYRFLANVATEIPNNAGYPVTESVRQNLADGTYVLVTRERFVTLLEKARDNPEFQVEGEPRAEVQQVHPEQMTTPAQYRAYAEQWFMGEDDLAQFQERWDDEEALREQCGVTRDDLRALEPVFKLRIDAIKQMLKA
jgi:hypothetical protein